MDCSKPGSSVFHYLPEFDQIHIYRVNDLTVSSSVAPVSFRLQSFPASFPMSWFFESDGQSIGASALASPSSEYSGLISFRID